MNIVYCSYDGRYSDNPRALYEGWGRSFRPGEQLWLASPIYASGFPAGVPTVTYGSPAARDALEAADLIVANSHLDLQWDKKPGATYLQTWHGTPLKRVHNDVFWAPTGLLAALNQDVVRWDYLVSPNAVSTQRLRSAFRFEGEVLETGYPRNDLLLSPHRRAVRDRVRARLGLSEDTTAVLYAPTWRDDEYYSDGAIGLALDVEAFVGRLGGNHTLLTRLHYLVTERGSLLRRPGLRDVSRYPDMQELFLAADVLVTDYSSSMFDFAITGKPIIFYTYDLERYRDSLRGFYFDLAPLAPGPMVRTTGEVLDALGQLPELQADFAVRYTAFRDTFCHLDDGHATSRLAWLTSPSSSGAELAAQPE